MPTDMPSSSLIGRLLGGLEVVREGHALGAQVLGQDAGDLAVADQCNLHIKGSSWRACSSN